MWMLTWKKYGTSKSATALSVFGALVRYGGVLCLFNGVIPTGIVIILIGIGIHYAAESMAHSDWVKYVQTSGLAQRIQGGDLQLAAQLYTKIEDDKKRQYLLSLNPQIPSYIAYLKQTGQPIG